MNEGIMRKKNYLILFVFVFMMICQSFVISAETSKETDDKEIELKLKSLSLSSPECHFWWENGAILKGLDQGSFARYIMRAYSLDFIEIDKSLSGMSEYRVVLKSKVTAERISVTVPQNYRENFINGCSLSSIKLKPQFESQYELWLRDCFTRGGCKTHEKIKISDLSVGSKKLESWFVEPWVDYCCERMMSEKDIIRRDGIIYRYRDYRLDILSENIIEECKSDVKNWQRCFRNWCDDFDDICHWRADCSTNRHGFAWYPYFRLPYDPFYLFFENRSGVPGLYAYIDRLVDKLEKIEFKRPDLLLPLLDKSINVLKAIFTNYVRYCEGGALISYAFDIDRYSVMKYMYVQHSISRLNLFLLYEMIENICDEVAYGDGTLDESATLEVMEHIGDFAQALSHREKIEIY